MNNNTHIANAIIAAHPTERSCSSFWRASWRDGESSSDATMQRSNLILARSKASIVLCGLRVLEACHPFGGRES